MKKHIVGTTFKRVDFCPIIITGFTHDGKYVLKQVSKRYSDVYLKSFFKTELKPGIMLMVPDGKLIELVTLEDGVWNTVSPRQEPIIMSGVQLDLLEAEHAVRHTTYNVKGGIYIG